MRRVRQFSYENDERTVWTHAKLLICHVDSVTYGAFAKNRNFLDHDGELSLDAGPFVAALEYASGREATVFGKPAAMFFKLAVESLRCAPEEVAMIGDDVEADVGGAMAAGLMGVLVRTGKYRPGQEAHLAERATWIHARSATRRKDWVKTSSGVL